MLEIRVTIEAAELAAALNNIAAAMGGRVQDNLVQVPPTVPAAPIPAPVAPMAVPQMNQMPAPAPVTPVVPTAPIANVPLAQPQKYTTDQIMAAGAALVDAGKTQELMNLLNSFGVQAVTALKPEQLGAFATAMREMGAKI